HWVNSLPANGRASVLAPARASDRKLDIGDWFYTPVWRPAPAPEKVTHSTATSWLVFCSDERPPAELVQVLQGRGDRVTTVLLSAPNAYSVRTDHVIDSSDPAAYRYLLRDLRRSGLVPQQIVYSSNAALQEPELTGSSERTAESASAFFGLL